MLMKVRNGDLDATSHEVEAVTYTVTVNISSKRLKQSVKIHFAKMQGFLSISLRSVDSFTYMKGLSRVLFGSK